VLGQSAAAASVSGGSELSADEDAASCCSNRLAGDMSVPRLSLVDSSDCSTYNELADNDPQ